MSPRALVLASLALALTAARADAFCGFYVGGAGAQMFNNATEVVLMRHGTTTVLSMQNNYQGPPDHFAMVVPVPVVVRQENVKTLPREVFQKIDTLGAPRLVEYWEQDPCYAPPAYGGGGGGDDEEDDEAGADADEPAPPRKHYHVTIEAKFSVGEYDIVVLSAKDSTGLESWLQDNHYAIPPGAAPLLRPYIEQGTKFFVAKVDPKKVHFENGMAMLSPLRFHYDSPDFTLPIRLGLANSKGTQDLIVNILAPNTRYEAANYKNVTIPTNLAVTDSVRDRFGEFYAALFDYTVAQVPGAVVTEYAWSSGGCDPCPGPTLDAGDLATFGKDVIDGAYANDASAREAYTLTRLHARYGKDITNDLVFRAVDPLGGGRGIPDANGGLSTALDHDGNDFQGRYVIEHPWTGPIACDAPRRGRWGGPVGPQRTSQIADPIAATNTAFAPRGRVELASLLAGDVPQSSALASNGVRLPTVHARQNGCGCDAGAGGGLASGLGTLGVMFGLRGLGRRRAR